VLRVLSLVLVVASGCMTVGDEPTATITVGTENSGLRTPTNRAFTELSDTEAVAGGPASADVCALAAALPVTDVCSLICDPSAMAAYLIDQGMPGGRCYELRCVLSSDAAVNVGVCLSP